MADITKLILADHDWFREQFAKLDDLQAQTPIDHAALERVWRRLGEKLDLHAYIEEQIFYPQLLKRGVDDPEGETLDAIGDHNDIRDGVRAANAAANASSTAVGPITEPTPLPFRITSVEACIAQWLGIAGEIVCAHCGSAVVSASAPPSAANTSISRFETASVALSVLQKETIANVSDSTQTASAGATITSATSGPFRVANSTRRSRTESRALISALG